MTFFSDLGVIFCHIWNQGGFGGLIPLAFIYGIVYVGFKGSSFARQYCGYGTITWAPIFVITMWARRLADHCQIDFETCQILLFMMIVHMGSVALFALDVFKENQHAE